jgi:hypothetical protein
MPKGSHKYFENLASYGKPLRPEHPEFRGQVLARLGGRYEEAFDPSLARYVGPDDLSLSLRGFQASPGAPVENKLQQVGRAGGDVSGLDAAPGVYGIGRGATPTTWAHEFRHLDVKDEGTNRLMDVAFSPSLQAYQSNVRSAYAYYADQWGLEPEVTFREKEKYVIGRLNPGMLDPKFSLVEEKSHREFNRTGEWPGPDIGWGPTFGSVETPQGRLPKRALRDRAKYPYFMWVGRDDHPPAPERLTASSGAVPLSSMEKAEPRPRNPLRSLGMAEAFDLLVGK